MKNKIDKKIKRKFQEDNYIPNSTKNAINNILMENRNIVINIKPNKPSILKKLVTVIASIIVVFIGSISVYAAFGGKISDKPIIEWLGIKFSDEYEDYKMDVEGQEVMYNETKIDLTSTVCDDGFSIFEFDVKLSKEDKEYLKLEEPLVTEEELKSAEEAALKEKEENYEIGVDKYEKQEYYEILLRCKGLTNTLNMVINDDLLGPNYAKYNILIDGKGYYTKSTQTVTKISDYEYRVYQLYFLTDEILGEKTDFSVTLKLNAIENIADKSGYKKTENNPGLYPVNTQENRRRIDINGEFVVDVSKNKALENTKIIKPDSGKSTYKNLTKEIEEIRITPLQIIAKVKTHIDNVSLHSLSYTRDKDYIGIIDFNVYDNHENELVSQSYETKRTITYANGKVEEWSPGDIGTYKSFYNAEMDLIEYVIIEKKENVDSIKIVPTVRELIFSDSDSTEKEVELNALEVNFEQ